MGTDKRRSFSTVPAHAVASKIFMLQNHMAFNIGTGVPGKAFRIFPGVFQQAEARQDNMINLHSFLIPSGHFTHDVNVGQIFCSSFYKHLVLVEIRNKYSPVINTIGLCTRSYVTIPGHKQKNLHFFFKRIYRGLPCSP